MGERVVTGRSGVLGVADREQVHRDGTWHWCVHLLATNGTHVYLQRRATHLARNPDCWESTAAGHVTAEDAADSQGRGTIQDAGRVALMHEIMEELGATWDVDRARYLGDIDSTGLGGGEVCNCHVMLFRLEVGEITFSPTFEVPEVKSFEVDEITRAIRQQRGLAAADGNERQFANNFPPIFERFLAPP